MLAAVLSVPPVNVEPRQREGAVWYATGAPSFSYGNNVYTVIVFYYFDLVQFASQHSANVCIDQRWQVPFVSLYAHHISDISTDSAPSDS